ncbi:hypothetical protein PSECIP111951_03647 [Pseudoalteromonas holothuriae]|uniref:Soluble cytochrome b562 n=1 Tax=Pseudoalteromonas holothuriae TaxID=2963714 RepID=A0A9W4W5W4_9GAMM|nr:MULTISPECIES: cytochrome b562 [unclassified Pseudoalteromonas]CAH9062495.1 hypothetical protein PSECIP111854_03024 [Pseudoalteromonas sp. CIP111854]CAH9066800.1 hypothetical protein PSECIP111951_03647 [Pseudoalteromonas sp. CIP111951]
MYNFLLLVLLSLSTQLFAQQSSKLEVTMKNMGHAYKQAMKSESQQQLLSSIKLLTDHLLVSKQHQFNAQLHDKSQAGLDKVLRIVNDSKLLANEGKLADAKTKLLEVDKLRKQYHKLHEPPSIWDLLFGN